MKNNTLFKSGKLYHGIHRWHFFAGMFVLPFLLLLSVSGLLMLITKPVEPLFNKALFEVTPSSQSVSAATMLTNVQAQNPHAKVTLYIAPKSDNESAQFSLAASSHAGHSQPSKVVFVNPYNGNVLGSLDPTQSLYTLVKSFHGSLFLGNTGDMLIEVASGLGILMILSGFYMAWPSKKWRVANAAKALTQRGYWLRVHKIIGLVVGIPLFVFLLSGLAWTNFWGGQLVQPWGSLSVTRYTAPEAPIKKHVHKSMNQQGVHQVPWAMEQTPMPVSGNKTASEINLDSVTNIAKQHGFKNFRVRLPQTNTDVWTISATTIAGDITNPLAERTLHLDQFSGKVLADIPFASYPALGQAMATFVPFHQGDLGWWNWLLNVALVLMIIALLLAGVLMWWKRRPKSKNKLAPPAAQPNASKFVIAFMLLISLCFPLSALALVLMILIDWLVISRVKGLKARLK